jgi:tetratricopeptide (TPR) repeat protein
MLSLKPSVWILTVTLAATLELAASPLAQAANEDEARVYLDKATAAYALNKYAVAAENFEKAFELKPDPALLYNAAQAYRLGGNKERALALYESYLRVYGKKGSGREQIETRIRELKQAIQHDRSVATSPPVTTLPVGKAGESSAGAAAAVTAPPPVATSTPPPPPPVPAPAPVTPLAAAPVAALPPAPPPADKTSDDPTMLTHSGSPKDDESILKKPLFWVGVGGAVVAVGLVVLLLASGGEKAASPSFGQVEGN